MQTSTKAETAHAAALDLYRAVSMKWMPDAAPRVREWLPTIEAAFLAYLEGRPRRPVDFPEGATSRDGATSDQALNILENFNDWLGRDIVWTVLDQYNELRPEIEC